MTFKLTTFLFLALVTTFGLLVQDDSEKDDKPEPAFIRIINATTADLPEAWRSGVDLKFKDQPLAIDIRSGDAASYKRIFFTGKDSVEVTRTGTSKLVGKVPANFKKGEFYTIYLSGPITTQEFEATPLVVKDFPVDPKKSRKEFARIAVFNAIEKFPVQLQVEDGGYSPLPPNVFTDSYLSSGTHPYSLKFPINDSQAEIHGRFIVQANLDYTAVVFASGKKTDRPALRFINNTTAMNDILEDIKNKEQAEKAKKKEEATAVETPIN